MQDVVKDLFDHAQTALEHDIRELRAPEYPLFHVLEPYILEPEDLLGVVISNEGP